MNFSFKIASLGLKSFPESPKNSSSDSRISAQSRISLKIIFSKYFRVLKCFHTFAQFSSAHCRIYLVTDRLEGLPDHCHSKLFSLYFWGVSRPNQYVLLRTFGCNGNKIFGKPKVYSNAVLRCDLWSAAKSRNQTNQNDENFHFSNAFFE